MDWTLVKRELLKNPDVAREYAALEDEDEAARAIISKHMEKERSQRWLAKKMGPN